MHISVILCTYNRCRSLTRALDSVAGSKLPKEVKWEILVVDNNSNDDTRKVVADYCARHPGRFRYLFESQPGKSYALNSGVREARGQVLAFVDDDVTVEAGWLESLTASFYAEKCAGCCGPIIPQWTNPPPRWLPQNEPYGTAPLVSFDLGHFAGLVTETPFGTNMAFRREVFEKYGGFRTDLGPRPGSELRNEDSEFCQRLLAAGERFWYEPSAVVNHPVTQERLKKKYFLAWWFDKGRAEVLQHGPLLVGTWCIRRVPFLLFPRIGVAALRWIFAVGQPRRFSMRLNVWYLAGQILACYLQGRSQARQRESSA